MNIETIILRKLNASKALRRASLENWIYREHRAFHPDITMTIRSLVDRALIAHCGGTMVITVHGRLRLQEIEDQDKPRENAPLWLTRPKWEWRLPPPARASAMDFAKLPSMSTSAGVYEQYSARRR